MDRSTLAIGFFVFVAATIPLLTFHIGQSKGWEEGYQQATDECVHPTMNIHSVVIGKRKGGETIVPPEGTVWSTQALAPGECFRIGTTWKKVSCKDDDLQIGGWEE
jgi:hypothetical protein